MTETMSQRVIRVPDDVWEAAKRQANNRGEAVSSAVRRFLEEYGRMSVGKFLREVERDIAQQTYEGGMEIVVTAVIGGKPFVWTPPEQSGDSDAYEAFVEIAMRRAANPGGAKW